MAVLLLRQHPHSGLLPELCCCLLGYPGEQGGARLCGCVEVGGWSDLSLSGEVPQEAAGNKQLMLKLEESCSQNSVFLESFRQDQPRLLKSSEFSPGQKQTQKCCLRWEWGSSPAGGSAAGDSAALQCGYEHEEKRTHKLSRA